MSIEARARSASSELRASVAHRVDTSEARARLDHRRHMRRLETAVVLVLGVVLLSGSAVVLQRSFARPSLPSSVPVVDNDASLARECLFIRCAEGVYRAALSVPTTFAAQGLVSVSSDSPDVLLVTNVDDSLTIAANPYVEDGNGEPVDGSATALAASLADRKDLHVSPNLDVTVAGRPGIQLDITAAESDHPTVLFTAGSAHGSPIELESSEAVRLTLVDVPGSGTVAVLVRDPTSGPEAPRPAAQRLEPLVASLVFGTS